MTSNQSNWFNHYYRISLNRSPLFSINIFSEHFISLLLVSILYHPKLHLSHIITLIASISITIIIQRGYFIHDWSSVSRCHSYIIPFLAYCLQTLLECSYMPNIKTKKRIYVKQSQEKHKAHRPSRWSFGWLKKREIEKHNVEIARPFKLIRQLCGCVNIITANWFIEFCIMASGLYNQASYFVAKQWCPRQVVDVGISVKITKRSLTDKWYLQIWE